MIDLSGKDDLSIIRHLDDKIDRNIRALLDMRSDFHYTVEDLDKLVNDSETLREYILDTENAFALQRERPLDEYSANELTAYVTYLDGLYNGGVI